MKRALLYASLSLGLTSGLVVSGVAQAKASPKLVRPAIREDAADMSSDVRIVPTAMEPGSSSIEVDGDQWSVRGYALKDLIAQIFNIDERLVDVASGVDLNARYDLSLNLPPDAGQDEVQKRVVSALEKKFRLTVTPEAREMSVYVLTAPNGPGPALHTHVFPHRADVADDDDPEGRITFFGRDCTGRGSSGGLKVEGGSISDFRRELESDLDRVLVDETKLTGEYDFSLNAYKSQDELFKLMHEQLGLVVAQEQRKLTVMVVKPAGMLRAEL